MMGVQLETTRRGLLGGSAVLAGALMVPFGAGCAAAAGAASVAPNAWLAVTADGKVALALPKTEMGQGVYTSLTMIAAEELAVAPADVIVTIPDGDAARYAPLDQGTGGSTTIREMWQPMREAAATARAALIGAAARQWKVAEADCEAKAGAVLHKSSGKVLPYAALVSAAAAAPLPKDAPLRAAADFNVVGTSLRRLDGAAKARGTAEYGIDVVLPGMKHAALAQSPVFGGKVAKLNEAAARAVPGVVGVVRGEDVVFVIADNTWAARKGIEAAAVEWTAEPARTSAGQAALVADVSAGLDKPGFVAGEKGDLAKAKAGAAKTFEATYHQPFLAHATMEPGNCVAWVRDGTCEIWTGSQVPSSARAAAAKALDLPLEKVTLHNRLMGGGFGRRLETDLVTRGVQLAKQVPFPVKLTWSREEDMTHDWYRPAYADRLSIALDGAGKPLAWEHKIAGSSIMARLMGPGFKGVDDDAVDGAVAPLYDAGARKVTFQQVESLVPTSWWRGVGGLRNTFAIESFIDEVAHSLAQDPMEYRLSLITDPRARGVLESVRSQSGWGTKMASGIGMGVAVLHLWDTYMAAVAEVQVGSDKQITIRKVTVAVDCGQPVNPSGIRAQIDSGVIFGGSAALWGEVTIAGGKVEQSNFHDYRAMRLAECPRIDTMIIASHEKPGGMGEPPCAIIAPALANAVFAATGKRVRTLPLQKGLEGAA
jgi:isoquinoline 1-oxidoreductase beta subunit